MAGRLLLGAINVALLMRLRGRYGAVVVYMRRLLGTRDPASLSLLQLISGTVIVVPR